MSVSLASISLPDAMEWSDEFSSPSIVAENTTRLLNGIRYIEESAPPSGRSITLQTAFGVGVTRTVVESLYALITPGRIMTLSFHGRSISVRWRHSDGALKATLLMFYTPPDPTDLYSIELYLETV